MKPMIDSDQVYYCVGGRTAVAIRAPAPEHAGAAFEQNRIGLHHLCFRARERADIDELHDFLCSIGTTIVRAPREDRLGAGILLAAVRGPRRHQAGTQPRSGQGPARLKQEIVQEAIPDSL